jgi:hypothetical protein
VGYIFNNVCETFGKLFLISSTISSFFNFIKVCNFIYLLLRAF